MYYTYVGIAIALVAYAIPTTTFAGTCASGLAAASGGFDAMNPTPAAEHALGQRFTPSSDCTATSSTQNLYKNGSPNGTVIYRLLNDSSGSPGTEIEASSGFSPSILNGTGSNITEAFSGTTCLEAGTYYWIVGQWDSGTTGQVVHNGQNNGDDNFWGLNWSGTWVDGGNGNIPNSFYYTVNGTIADCAGGGAATSTSATSTPEEILATSWLYFSSWIVFISTLTTTLWIFRLLA